MAKKNILDTGVLGKIYQDGEVIVRQGEVGDCMYVIQEGQVEVVTDEDGTEVRLAVLGEREFFGEMSIFDREVRMATVRALGPVRVLTVDIEDDTVGGLYRRLRRKVNIDGDAGGDQQQQQQ